MTNQGGPDDRRSAADYIDQSSSVGWTPIVLGVVFLGLLAVLVFGASWNSTGDRTTPSQRSEMPSTAPTAPSVPTPAPPKPQ